MIVRYILPFLFQLFRRTTDTPIRAAVREVEQITIDLSSVDFKIFRSTRGFFGPKIYEVEFDLVMVVENDFGYMQFYAECQGQRIGEVRVEIGHS